MTCIKKLFVTDMDGTFLDSRGGYDRKRLEALLVDAEAQGYGFAVASGRGILALEPLFEGLEDRLSLIAENGALVRQPGRPDLEEALDPTTYQQLVADLLAGPCAQGQQFLLSGKAGAYVLTGTDPAYLAHASRYYENLQEVADLSAIDDTIYKLTAQFTPETVAQEAAQLNALWPDMEAVMTGPDAVDIIKKGVNKASGLTLLCQGLGLELTAVTAFGDNGNDKELLTQAGHGIAVANARPEILALADQVIGHHDDGAVLGYMEAALADIKLLALDLDGTLLTSDKQVSEANRRALALARQEGVQVVITTGRPLPAIQHLLEELDLTGPDQYSITFNGGLVQRNDGQILSQSGLSLSEIERIYHLLDRLALPVDVVSEGLVYNLPSSGPSSLYHTANPSLTFIPLDSPADLPKNRNYQKVVVVCEEVILNQRLLQLPQELVDQFEVFKSRNIVFEVMPKGVTKATGLAQLTQYLGLEAHQVLAVGDEENDQAMLAWAGWGLAMANAVPKAKAAARLSLDRTNDQAGVAQAVHRYILKEDYQLKGGQ